MAPLIGFHFPSNTIARQKCPKSAYYMSKNNDFCGLCIPARAFFHFDTRFQFGVFHETTGSLSDDDGDGDGDGDGNNNVINLNIWLWKAIVLQNFKSFIYSGSTLSYQASSQALHIQSSERNNWNEVNRLRIPTGRRQTSWLSTSAAEGLNQEFLGTNPVGGQSGTLTRDLGFPSPLNNQRLTWFVLVVFSS